MERRWEDGSHQRVWRDKQSGALEVRPRKQFDGEKARDQKTFQSCFHRAADAVRSIISPSCRPVITSVSETAIVFMLADFLLHHLLVIS